MAAGIALGLLVEGASRADPAPKTPSASVDFAWDAPDGCPDRARVIEQIERLTGRPVEAGAEPKLSVDAVVTRSEDRFSLRIVTRAGSDTRERNVDAGSCKEAGDAAALIVAMALDPALSLPPPGGASPTSEPGANPSPPSSAARAGAAAAAGDASVGDRGAPGRPVAKPGIAPPLRLRGEVRASFALDVGALPAPAPGAEIAAGLWVGSFRFEATGAVFPEQRRSLPSGAGGDIGLASGGVGAWFAPFFKPIELHVGTALEAGVMWGRGFGEAAAKSGSAPWIAARPGVEAAYVPTDRLGFSVGASAVVPLIRDRFLVGVDEVFVPAPVSLRACAGLFVRFQ